MAYSVESVIAYKTNDGTLFYNPDDAASHNQKLWEESLDVFISKNYQGPEWEKNPIKAKTQLMDFIIKHRERLGKLIAQIETDV